MRKIDVYTPGATISQCHYGRQWWSVLQKDGQIMAGDLEGVSDVEGAIAQAVGDGAIAVAEVHHAAYNHYPTSQTIANWVIDTYLGRLQPLPEPEKTEKQEEGCSENIPLDYSLFDGLFSHDPPTPEEIRKENEWESKSMYLKWKAEGGDADIEEWHLLHPSAKGYITCWRKLEGHQVESSCFPVRKQADGTEVPVRLEIDLSVPITLERAKRIWQAAEEFGGEKYSKITIQPLGYSPKEREWKYNAVKNYLRIYEAGMPIYENWNGNICDDPDALADCLC